MSRYTSGRARASVRHRIPHPDPLDRQSARAVEGGWAPKKWPRQRCRGTRVAVAPLRVVVDSPAWAGTGDQEKRTQAEAPSALVTKTVHGDASIGACVSRGFDRLVNREGECLTSGKPTRGPMYFARPDSSPGAAACVLGSSWRCFAALAVGPRPIASAALDVGPRLVAEGLDGSPGADPIALGDQVFWVMHTQTESQLDLRRHDRRDPPLHHRAEPGG